MPSGTGNVEVSSSTPCCEKNIVKGIGAFPVAGWVHLGVNALQGAVSSCRCRVSHGKLLPSLLFGCTSATPPAGLLSFTDLLRKGSGHSVAKAKEGMARSAHSRIQGACRATGGCPWGVAHLSTSSIYFLTLISGKKEASTSLRVEGKEVSCKWNCGTHCRVTARMTPRQPRCTRTARNTSALLDSEHSRMVPSAVSRVSATTWQQRRATLRIQAGISRALR